MTDSATARDLDPRLLLAPLQEVADTGVMPEASLTAQIAAHAERVLEIDPATLYELLTPPLCAKHPHVALQWLRDAGILIHILPELDATHDFSQEGGRRHKDVWDHTKTVVRQAVPRPIVRWAAALHDIGKVPTRRFLPGGKVTFHGHAEEGVRMFRRGPAKRIAFPDAERETIIELIRHHLRPGQYEPGWTDSAVRRFHREMEPFLTDLLDLGRADITSKRPGKRASCLRSIHALATRIEELAAEDAKPKPLPAGLGNLLMSGLSLPPGKHLGDLRKRLVALYEAGDLLGGQPAEYYLDVVRERDLMNGIEIQKPRGF
ncbi:MAG: HD domain-containing protein [Myxococcota bacterium]